jgi:superfamily II DNA or RNA helicase
MGAVFESCWNSGDFVDFDPVAFREATRDQSSRVRSMVLLPGIELRLEPFQERMLELIAIERARGRHRNLLVSATGTGKTVMAAMDYARLRRVLPRARLLFIAHRKEILEQSCAMFRYALRDVSFGELWVDGQRPDQFEQVFASVQSLAHVNLAHLDPEHFDMVIVDEFHHAAAPTYRTLLEHLRPRELLGLTATPERADGQSIITWFDGRIAAEMRLWDAIDQQLLVPFAYYGIPDQTDLRGIAWKRGRGYDIQALTNVLTADRVWADLVIRALVDKVGDLGRIRALGFCVSVPHADFMARVFSERGITAVALSGASQSASREDALRRLAAGELKVVFSVDLFNEGLDLPAVDTLLFLRPTESPTLFLQQLGRGLRRHEGKSLCTVLDFVGQHRREFSYEGRLRAMLGVNRRQLIDQVEAGFPFLPSGCHMVLEGVARDRVLQSLKSALPRGLNRMVEVVRSMQQEGHSISLSSFLEHSGLDLDDVYDDAGRGRCWSDILEASQVEVAPPGPHEVTLRRACARLLHIDDVARLRSYASWLSQPQPPQLDSMDVVEIRRLRMLLASLGASVAEIRDQALQPALSLLWQHPQVRFELIELLDLLLERAAHLGHPLRERAEVPLQVHARYTRVEIQAAFGDCKAGESEQFRVDLPVWREGVKWLSKERCDLLLVTLNKTDKRFSPTTRYRDYAIGRDLLHWESQSGTRSSSPTGQRYQRHVEQGSAVMIFARLDTEDRAFHFLGPARYVGHQGEMPMSVTWRLIYPLPGDLLAQYRAAVA